VLAFAGAVAAACGGAGAEAPAAGRRAVPVPAESITVTAAVVEERAVPITVRATGTFVADESSDVTSQVPGSVVQTLVDVGDTVRSGQLLVRLDDRQARLELSQAQAALQQVQAQAENARVEARRHGELVESGDISRSTYEKLTTQLATGEAAVAQARARVSLAEKALDDTSIAAPLDGAVSARPVAVGEYVTPSTKLVTIVRIHPLRLEIQVPESYAATLQIGMAVRAEVPAHPGTVFTGTITARNPAIDPSSRVMTVEARFANRDGKLTPGMFATAEIQLPATEPALFVPRRAVTAIANAESSIVYVVDGDTVRVRVVQLGQEQDGTARILSGVEAGAMVATSQLAQLFDGATVRVSPGEPAAPALRR
jgi:RND family efflux transporter MFP subunit